MRTKSQSVRRLLPVDLPHTTKTPGSGVQPACFTPFQVDDDDTTDKTRSRTRRVPEPTPRLDGPTVAIRLGRRRTRRRTLLPKHTEDL